MVERQSRCDFEAVPRRHVSAFSAIARGSASANEIVRARRGSPPVRATARLSAAIRRASGEADQFRVAEADVDPAAVHHEPLDPGAGAAVAHPQHEAVAVHVAAGAGVAYHLGGQGVAIELGHGTEIGFRAETHSTG